MMAADTKANVYLSIVGAASETAFIHLNSTPSQVERFQLGQEDIFQFDSPFVGKIEKVKVRLEGRDEECTWYLKDMSITVNEVSLRYLFAVDKWLTARRHDNKKVYEFIPTSVERLFTAVPYEITFYTGSESKCETGAPFYLQLFGNEGAKQTETLLFQSDGRIFNAGNTDTFTVYSSEVGKITKARVGLDVSSTSTSLLLKRIRVRKAETHNCSHCHKETCPYMRISRRRSPGNAEKCENSLCNCHEVASRKSEALPLLTLQNRPLDEYWFFANRWLPPRDDENGQLFCELLPAKSDGTPLSAEKPVVYHVSLKTGNLSGSGTSAQVYLKLIGATSESGEFRLFNAKRLTFSAGREAIFKVEAIGLGKLNGIRLRHDNTGPSPDWYVEEVTVREVKNGKGNSYHFLCNQWLTAIKNGSGHLIRQFPLSQTIPRRDEVKPLSITDRTNENVEITQTTFLPVNSSSVDAKQTKPSKPAPPGLVVSSPERKNGPVVPHESRLPPDPEANSSSTSTLSTVNYVEMEQKEATTTYKVAITTGTHSGSGTSSNVYLTMRGEKGESGKIPLSDGANQTSRLTRPMSGGTMQKPKKIFQSGNTDNFLLQLPDIGELKSIRLGHDNTGLSPTWFVEKVEVESTRTGSSYEFPCHQWILKSEENGEAYAELAMHPPSIGTIQRKIFYEFKIFTSDLVNAGTEASVFAVLTGPKGQKTSEVQLKGVFKRGGREILYVDLEDVGEPLRSLHIKHNNTGPNPAWHLDRVEVRPIGSKLPDDVVYNFKCNRWLSESADGTEAMLTATAGHREATGPMQVGVRNTYELAVTTASMPNAGTSARVFLTLVDASGVREERQLVPPDSTKAFHLGQTDVFTWKGVPVKEVEKIHLRHDNTGLSPNWYVGKVTIRRLASQGSQETMQTFVCNRWISSTGDEFFPETAEVSTPSPISSLEDLKMGNGLPPTPSLEKLPPMPPEVFEPLVKSDSPLPPPPPVDLNGRPQIPPRQHGGDESFMLIPSIPSGPQPAVLRSEEEEVPYKITLTTGSEMDAGTQGPVLMNLVGPDGTSTGWLFFQTQAGNTALPLGSIKSFIFNAPVLSEVTTIEIYNQANEQAQNGWHLKHLRVEIPSTSLIYEIPCDLWVTDKGGNNKAYHRLVITPQHRVLKQPVMSWKKPMYNLRLWLDGCIPEKVDATLQLQIVGDHEAKTDVVIVDRDWAQHSRLLALQVQAEENVSPVNRVKMRFKANRPKEPETDWRITSAILQREDEMTSKQYYFTEWRWEEIGKQSYRCCDLTLLPPAKPLVTSYKIRVKTSSLPEANTNANVYIRLIGETVESADIHLKQSETNETPFQIGKIDQFTITNLPDFGALTGCRLWHDNRMPLGAWHCEWIYVIEVLPEASHLSPHSWYFPCNRWLRGDGRTHVVPLDLLPLDAKAAPDLALQEPEVINPPSEEGLKLAVESPRRIQKIDYVVEVETSNVMDAGTNLIGWIVIKGRNGISPVLRFTDSNGNAALRTGSTETFRLNCEPLGVISQIYVGLYDPHGHFEDVEEEPKYMNLQLNRQNQWNCRRIQVTDSRDDEAYLFNINQWIVAAPEIDRRHCVAARPAELRIVREKSVEKKKELFESNTAPTVIYRITIETEDCENAGTTANAYLTLYGNQKGSTSGSQRLQRISHQTFGRGKVDVFFVSCAKLGQVTRIQLEHDNTGSSPDWFIKCVTVTETGSGETWKFPCHAWLSLTQGSKSLRMEVKSA